MLAEEVVGVVIHHPEGSCTIFYPPSRLYSAVGPQLAAVTLTQGRELPVQGLKLGVQAVQGCTGVGCRLSAGQPQGSKGLEQWVPLGLLFVASWHGRGGAIGGATPGQGVGLGLEGPYLQ